MYVNYDLAKISATLADFYNATGIDLTLAKDDFSPIYNKCTQNNRYCEVIQSSEEGKKACYCSDFELIKKCKLSLKPEKHICHAGLVDVALPILFEDIIIGYIIFGRIKPENDFSKLEKYIASLGVDVEKANEFYDEIAFFDNSKIESISNIASMFVKYILLENILKPDFNSVINNAVNFINANLENDLTIKTISKEINVSKSVLYEKFHSYFNCTVSEYIKRVRIEKSVELLEKTNFSIEKISQKVGFSSASYYSKMFKEQMGKSPLKYKKDYKTK